MSLKCGHTFCAGNNGHINLSQVVSQKAQFGLWWAIKSIQKAWASTELCLAHFHRNWPRAYYFIYKEQLIKDSSIEQPVYRGHRCPKINLPSERRQQGKIAGIIQRFDELLQISFLSPSFQVVYRRQTYQRLHSSVSPAANSMCLRAKKVEVSGSQTIPQCR